MEFIAWIALLFAGFFGLFGHGAVTFTEEERARIFQHAAVPLPSDPTNRFADHPGAAHLGHYLFFETRFSANGKVSCATCHIPALGFADGRRLAMGLARVARHSPSLWNAAYQRWFFWDGRADSLWSQALAPLEDAKEFGGSRLGVTRTLYQDAELRDAYEAVFGPLPLLSGSRFPGRGEPVAGEPGHPYQHAWDRVAAEDRVQIDRVFANVGKAIAAYERLLVSGPSPFDRFVEGLREENPQKRAALSIAAQRGLKLFIGKANCRPCHSGPQFSDLEFHNNGIPPLQPGLSTDSGRYDGIIRLMANPFNAAGPFSDDQNGTKARAVRYVVRGPETWGRFKTPGLRNVALSPPYMHQGSIATLREVVDFYSTLQGQTAMLHHPNPLLVRLDLSEQEIDDLVAFLLSLTGPPPNHELLGRPASPALDIAPKDR